MDIAQLSLRRPITTIMVFVSMMVIGAIAAVRLPLEFFPAVDAPVVFVNVPYPGSSPEEIERTITRPIEEALATLSGVESIESQSTPEGATVIMFFDWGSEVAIKASEVRERIDAIRSDLPNDLQRYFVLKFSTDDQAIIKIRFASDQDLSNSYALFERKFKRPLERVAGVARAEISGVAPPEVEVGISADLITAKGVDLAELSQRLSAANFSISGGQINDAGKRFRVQPNGEFRELDEIRDLVINERGLKLRDVAEITLKPGKLDFRRHFNLRPTVGIDVFKERQANLVNVGRGVMDAVNKITNDPQLKGISVYVLENQGEGVQSSLWELGEAGLLGTLLSMVVLYLFLRHWPSTLMVSLAVPICFVVTLGIMYFLGLTLNVLSMMGLLLGVGMVVDNAVVAVESIYQEREKYPNDPARASVTGVRNVAIALSAGTLCHCIVFLPNIFGGVNQISIFLSNVAYAITISLLVSWLVAVTLIPMISAKIPAPQFIDQDNWSSRMKQWYAKCLEWTLQHRGKTMAMTFGLLVLSIIPMQLTKTDMFPRDSTRDLELEYDLNGIYTLDELDRNITKVERFLLDNKKKYEIESVYSWFSEQFGIGTRLQLSDPDHQIKTTNEIMEMLRKDIPQIPIATIGFGDGDGGGGGGGNGLQISLVGDSTEVLREISEVVIPSLQKIDGIAEVRTDNAAATRELAISVDRERAATFGFSSQQVASFIAIALRGAPMREFRTEQGEIPVWLRFQESDKASLDDLRDFKLQRADGSSVPLASLVNAQVRDSASSISRSDRQTAFALSIKLKDKVAESDVREKLELAMKAVAMPPGYRWAFGGGFERSDEAGAQMGFNTMIALLMIFIVMAALFESMLFPLAIMTSILFSFFGVYWLFLFTNTTFSIMASIGILILMGVVVNNGIVMVEHINQLRHAGMPRNQALIQGSRDRLRPILMTMGCTILGMLPLCLGDTQIGGNGPPYYPMARAIVGGLIFSTIITLVVLPTIYALLDDMRISARLFFARLIRGAPIVAEVS